ncbi:MAG: patatin-like phospholipase family protein [Planctomycetota bacterium]
MTRPFQSALRLMLAIALLMNFCACSSAKRPPKSQAQLLAEREAVLTTIERGKERFDSKTIRRVIQEHRDAQASGTEIRPVFDILIVSGGGDYGAFGAGVLKGWGTLNDPAETRPEFDIVTGVSTGSLIAPFAFIGTDEAIDEIYTLYTNPDEDWAVVRSGLFFLPSNSSLIDPSGLHEALEHEFDIDKITKVKGGWAEHRQLLVGTTNLDLGFMRIFDLTRIADEATQSNELTYFHNVLKASIAVPGAFPPVEIDGHLHVDGGATLSVFLPAPREMIIQGEMLQNQLPGDVSEPKFRIWAIVNNKLAEGPENTGLSWLDNVARSLSTAIRSSVQLTLRDLETITLLSRVKGQDVEFRYICIPEEFEIPEAEALFDTDTMNALGELGMRLGSDFENWQTQVPGPEWAVDFFPQTDAKP